MKAEGYFHQCHNPNAKRRTYIRDIPQGDDNVLILQLADMIKMGDECTRLTPEQIAAPQQSITLKHLVKDAGELAYNVFGVLDGYITRTGAVQYQTSDQIPGGDGGRGVTCGHYCSVTMCRVTGV